MNTVINERKAEKYLELALKAEDEGLRLLLIKKVADLVDETLHKQNKGQRDINNSKRISKEEEKKLQELAEQHFIDSHIEHAGIIKLYIENLINSISKPVMTEEEAEKRINESINNCKKKLKELEETKRNVNEYIQHKEKWYLEQREKDLDSIRKILDTEVEFLEKRKELEMGYETLNTAIANMEQVKFSLKGLELKQGDDNCLAVLKKALVMMEKMSERADAAEEFTYEKNIIVEENENERNREELIDEIADLDNLQLQSVKKCISMLKKKKELNIAGPLKDYNPDVLNITFSSSIAGSLLMCLKKTELQEYKHESVLGIPAKLHYGFLKNVNEDETRKMILNSCISGITEDDISINLAYYLSELDKYLKNVDTLRIWYSNTAEDLCGLYFLCDHLLSKGYEGKILLNCSAEETIWEDKYASEFEEYMGNGIYISKTECQVNKAEWDRLVQENTMLRVYKDGCVISVKEEYFDEEINLTIEGERTIVSRMLGNWYLIDQKTAHKYQEWFYYRVNCLIKEKKLEVVEVSKYTGARTVKRTERFPLPKDEVIRRADEMKRERVFDEIERVLDEMNTEQLKKVLEMIQ